MTIETETEERTRWLVPLESIVALVNPMEDDIWGCGKITATDVLACHDNRSGRHSAGRTPDDSESKEYNVARIAWLMENYDWNNLADDEPIQIELMENGYWYPIIDGNHRVAAAIVLGLEHVIVEISGDIEYCEQVLKPIQDFGA